MLRMVRWMMLHRVRVLVGTVLTVAFCVQCQEVSTRTSLTSAPNRALVATRTISIDPRAEDPAVALLESDPLTYLERSRQTYESGDRREYTCTFVKEELIDGQMSKEQHVAVKFRESPYSVVMDWVVNPDRAKTVLYIKDQWTSGDGVPLALVKPAGAIISMFISSVKRPIYGPEAEDASRRSIDQFGFRNTFDMVIRYCDLAKQRGELELRYLGDATFDDGRPVYVLERRLPYTGEGGPYPDRVLTVYMDKEWNLPTACFQYADDAKNVLLGKYLITDVNFDVQLSQSDFEPATYGM